MDCYQHLHVICNLKYQKAEGVNCLPSDRISFHDVQLLLYRLNDVFSIRKFINLVENCCLRSGWTHHHEPNHIGGALELSMMTFQ